MEAMLSLVCLIAGMLLVGMIALSASIRIVPEYRRLAVYRLGRYLGERGPGIVVLIPGIDRGITIDTRDEVAKAKAQGEMFGAIGQAQTDVQHDGKVEIDGRIWDATSAAHIAPGARVRVKRVVLEVESI
jgi:regulator of protease activity HflC (stomatin/prohibitin superfamily)